MLPKNRKRKFKDIEPQEEKYNPPEEENIKIEHFYKFLYLDNNVIGIIFSCIADDLNFLLYLREQKIKPYYNPIKWNKIDFYQVSKQIERLERNFIVEFKEYLDWDVVTDIQIKNQEFLEFFDKNISFSVISNKMRFDDSLDYNFFLKYKDQLDWTKIARWDYIAEDFIDIFHIELDWEVLSKQQGLTRYLLEKYINKIIISLLQTNINITDTLKGEIIDRREALDLDRDLERELENIDNEEEFIPELEPPYELLPEDFHPEFGPPNQQNRNIENPVDDEDSDLDIRNAEDEYESDEFYDHLQDNIPSEMTGINMNYTRSPPLILYEDEDIDILPTTNNTDIIINIIDEEHEQS
jgi:hypothetical protein